MYLLDTNVISELRKLGDGRADANVTAWLADRDANSFFISLITLMELEISIPRGERLDRRQVSILRQWVDGIVRPEFTARTLPVIEATALRGTRLHVPNQRKAWAYRNPPSQNQSLWLQARYAADLQPLIRAAAQLSARRSNSSRMPFPGSAIRSIPN